MPKEFTDKEIQILADKAFDDAWNIINSEDGWKTVKTGDHGEVIMTRKKPDGRKMYRVKARIECQKEKLIARLRDVTKLLDWNDTLKEFKVLREIDSDTYVSYQVTTEGGGGLVASRDFILTFKCGFFGDAYLQAGASLDYDYPKDPKIVRAWNEPGGQCIRPIPGVSDACEFIWLLDCEYNGWIPKSVLELAMPQAQLQFVDCVRKLAKTL